MLHDHRSSSSLGKTRGLLPLQICVALLYCHNTIESSFGKDPDAPVPEQLSEHEKIAAQLTEKFLSSNELSERDIPNQTSSELQELIKETFSSSPVKRADAAEQIGRLKERAILAIPFLVRLLDDNRVFQTEYYINADTSTSHVYQSVIDALVKIGKPAVGPCLLVAKHPSEGSFANSLYVLGMLKDSRAIEPMLRALKNSSDKIRFRAIIAINCDGFDYQTIPWNDPKFLAPLLEALNDEFALVQESAVRALGAHQDARATAALLDVLDGKTNRSNSYTIRKYAIQSLAKHQDPRVVPALLKTLHDDESKRSLELVRRQAAISLGEIGDRKIIDELFTVAKNKSLPPDVRDGAILGIVASKDNRYVEELKNMAQSQDEPFEIRTALLEAIQSLQGEKSLPFLTKLALATDEKAVLQCRAAMQVISLTKGAISDPKLLASFEAGYRPEGGFYHLGARAMRLVIKNGENETVKKLAREQLKRWDEPEKFPTQDYSGRRIVEMEIDSRSLRLRPAPN